MPWQDSNRGRPTWEPPRIEPDFEAAATEFLQALGVDKSPRIMFWDDLHPRIVLALRAAFEAMMIAYERGQKEARP